MIVNTSSVSASIKIIMFFIVSSFLELVDTIKEIISILSYKTHAPQGAWVF